MSKATKTTSKSAIEQNVSRVLNGYFLAALHDITQMHGGVNKFPMFNSLANSRLKPEDPNYKKLADPFNLTTEVKQFLAHIFIATCSELKNISESDLLRITFTELSDSDKKEIEATPQTKRDAFALFVQRRRHASELARFASAATTNCFIDFIYQFTRGVDFGEFNELFAAVDPKDYFGAKYGENMKVAFPKVDHLPRTLFYLFDMFLKVIAMRIAKFSWYKRHN
jgi:hypothetical protein